MIEILVTRPKAYSTQLLSELKSNGWHVHHYPMLAFKPKQVTNLPLKLNQVKYVVVNSPAAATFVLKQIPELIQHNISWIAMGPASAKCLHEQGIEQILVPSLHNSLGLLRENYFTKQDLILVVGGDAEQTVLSSLLYQQNYNFYYQAVYETYLPQIDYSHLNQMLLMNKIDIILIFSESALRNLLCVIPRELLITTKLLVVSKRIEKLAQNLGFKVVLRSDTVDSKKICYFINTKMVVI